MARASNDHGYSLAALQQVCDYEDIELKEQNKEVISSILAHD